jgi:arylsulfatase A-like enzyme
MITRREFLGSAAAVGAAAERPNVVLLMTDQQTLGAMSAAGNGLVRTPNMDRLAAEGTRFERSWCTSPVCGPARSSLVTGCYPTTAGVVYNGDRLAGGVPTLGEKFAAAGYETAWAGKWHLPAGFPGGHGPGQPPALPARQAGFEFLPFEIAERGKMGYGDFTDDAIARSAAEYIGRERKKPFLLGVSLHNPHDICYWVMDKLGEGHPARGEFGVPESALPPLPANFARDGAEPEFIRRCREREVYGPENTFTRGWDAQRWRRYLYGYYRMTERVDRAVGAVLDALKARGVEENTVVAFTSDHGEGMGAHGWVVKLMTWQEVVSVPLLWRWPGRIRAGYVEREAMASGADVMPTMCELAGVPLQGAVHGTSLAQRLTGRGGAAAREQFVQLAADPKAREMQGRAVRTERYKYVRFAWGERPEMLFDLERDPGETRNLVGDKGARRELEKHREMLARWMRRVGDPVELPARAG